ncbi:MAG: hypothetical protein LKF36_08530 [Lactobacillus sp.]|jgi:GH25 family lysozyme M1 (1,4-beta-N-acetylmuramidase)|nr:hypothetical protein [Lactobacillus sp.]
MIKKRGTYFKISTWLLVGLSLLGAVFSTTAQVQASDFLKFADVSSYQSSDEYFFQNLTTGNVAGVVVKLTQGSTDGDNYINPKAQAQIKNAKAAGLKVSLYHYAKYNGTQDAIDEANFFADAAKNAGLGADTVMVADVEDPSLSNPYGDTVTFQQQLKNRGYNNQVIYSMASWFWYNKVPRNYPAWVANYGTDAPGVDNAAAWQYTSNYNGLSLDMSYDFTGLFTNKSVSQAPAGDTSASSNNNVITVGGSGANGVKGNGSSAQHFNAGTAWKSNGIKLINGKIAYLVGADVYIYQDDTTQANVCTVANPCKAVDGNGNQIGSDGKFTAGSQWQIASVTEVNGQAAYQVSGTEYILASNTIGNGN